jgi:hypothetical protein
VRTQLQLNYQTNGPVHAPLMPGSAESNSFHLARPRNALLWRLFALIVQFMTQNIKTTRNLGDGLDTVCTNGSSCRSQWPRRLRRGSAAACLLGLWVWIRPGHGCLCLVNVVCCQVEVYPSGRSLVRRSPTECGVSECDREVSAMRRPCPKRGCCAMGEKKAVRNFYME